MQGLSTSCVQQRFALIRCCDSKGKKSRRRITREERRTLVESFINKYRLSNNGKFPSLNLTHKEVGGSFYIVREIVRDIIQENRVLGPGSPSMKALTLQDCLEEHETEYFAKNPHNELSKSSIGLAVDEEQIGISSHPYRDEGSVELVKSDNEEIIALTLQDCLEEHETEYFAKNPHNELSKLSIGLAVDEEQIGISSQPYRDEDSGELVKSDNEEIIASDQDSGLFSHVIQHEPNHLQQNSCGANEHENLVTMESKEENLRKPPLQTHDKTENSEESSSGVQDGLERCKVHKDEQPEPLYETLSITSPEEGLVLNKDVKSNCNSLAEAANMSTENNGNCKTTGTGALPEEKVFISSLTTSDHLFNNLVSSEEEFSSLVSSSTKTDSELSCSRRDDFIGPKEALSIQSLPNDPISNRTELIENTSSRLGDEVTKPTSLVSQNSVFPSSGTLQTEAPPVPQVYDMESTRQKTECVSAETLSQSTQEISTIQLKPGHETDGSSMNRGSCSSSKSANANEEIRSETNPVWNAIKAFVTALIKFWAE